MQKITPCLWFDDNAEEAVNFYVSVFSAKGGSASGGKNSKITGITHYGEAGANASGRPKGTVMTVTFQLEGQDFMALNGGPVFKFTEAVSLVVNCKTQKEIDHYWEKLSKGGDKKAQICGWLKDKYGLSWQIVPDVLPKMLLDKNKKRSEKVMEALLKMKKLEIDKLKRAQGER